MPLSSLMFYSMESFKCTQHLHSYRNEIVNDKRMWKIFWEYSQLRQRPEIESKIWFWEWESFKWIFMELISSLHLIYGLLSTFCTVHYCIECGRHIMCIWGLFVIMSNPNGENVFPISFSAEFFTRKHSLWKCCSSLQFTFRFICELWIQSLFTFHSECIFTFIDFDDFYIWSCIWNQWPRAIKYNSIDCGCLLFTLGRKTIWFHLLNQSQTSEYFVSYEHLWIHRKQQLNHILHVIHRFSCAKRKRILVTMK